MNDKQNKFRVLLISTFLALLFLGTVVWADSNGVWHRADDVQPGTFGLDEGMSGNFIFTNPVEFRNTIKATTIEVGVIKSNVTGGNVVIQLS